jgi:hypothetical protein
MPLTLRKCCLLLIAAVLPLAAVALALWGCPRQPRVGPDWTPWRLYEALADSGLGYEAKEVPAGLLLKASDLSWEEVERLFAQRPVGAPLPRGIGLVTVYPFRDSVMGTVEDGQLPLYPFYLRGHPEDLRRIAAALGH